MVATFSRNLVIRISTIFLLLGIAWTVFPITSAIAAVDLLYFMADPGTSSIVLFWETATEFNNVGFRIHRALAVSGPFTPVSDFIPSGTDPFMGYFYQFEDETVTIGIQYYYTLEIINNDGTSEFTLPIEALIPAPTPTRTSAPTFTKTPGATPSSTPTQTPTSVIIASPTATISFPSYTPTYTLQPTASLTPTPTTTLEPFNMVEIGFPAITLTTISGPGSSPAQPRPSVTQTPSVNSEVDNSHTGTIIATVIILWLFLAIFLLLFFRQLKKNDNSIS